MTVQPSSATTDTAAGDRLHAQPQPDPQDPLPESNWIPRRWSSFAVCIGAALLLLLIIIALWRIAGGALATMAEPAAVLIRIVAALASLSSFLILVIVIDRILLMVAPSAEQVVKMIQTAGLLIRGVTLRSETRTTATADTAETVTRSEASTAAPPAPAAPARTGEDEPDPVVPPGRD